MLCSRRLGQGNRGTGARQHRDREGAGWASLARLHVELLCGTEPSMRTVPVPTQHCSGARTILADLSVTDGFVSSAAQTTDPMKHASHRWVRGKEFLVHTSVHTGFLLDL